MATTDSWKIRAHGDHCSLTGKPFKDGEVFYSCLTEATGADRFHREDFSAPAWLEVRARLQPFSFWRLIYESKTDPARKRGEAMRPHDAEALLHQLMEQGDPSLDQARYILAIMLERNKILRQVGQEQQAGRRLLLYEHRATGESLIIADPEISLEQAANIDREVRQWLASKQEGGTAGDPRQSQPDQATASA